MRQLTRGDDASGDQTGKRPLQPALHARHTAVALVRAGAVFHKGKLLERPSDITPPEPSESTATDGGRLKQPDQQS